MKPIEDRVKRPQRDLSRRGLLTLRLVNQVWSVGIWQ
jgi:hypothetical protein